MKRIGYWGGLLTCLLAGVARAEPVDIAAEAEHMIAKVEDAALREKLTQALATARAGGRDTYVLTSLVDELGCDAFVPVLLVALEKAGSGGDAYMLTHALEELTGHDPRLMPRDDAALHWRQWWLGNRETLRVSNPVRELRPVLEREIREAIEAEPDAALRGRLQEAASAVLRPERGWVQLPPELLALRVRAAVPMLAGALLLDRKGFSVEEIHGILSDLTGADLDLGNRQDRRGGRRAAKAWTAWWLEHKKGFAILPYREFSPERRCKEAARLVERLLRRPDPLAHRDPRFRQLDKAVFSALREDDIPDITLRSPPEVFALVALGPEALAALEARAAEERRVQGNLLLAFRAFLKAGALPGLKESAFDAKRPAWNRAYDVLLLGAAREDRAAEAVEALYRGSDNLDLRALLLEFLGILRDRRSATLLREALASDNGRLRLEAARAAVALPIEGAGAALGSALEREKDAEVAAEIEVLLLKNLGAQDLAFAMERLSARLREGRIEEAYELLWRVEGLTGRSHVREATAFLNNDDPSPESEQQQEEHERRVREALEKAARQYLAWWESEGREETARRFPAAGGAEAPAPRADAELGVLISKLDSTETAGESAYVLERRGREVLPVLERELALLEPHFAGQIVHCNAEHRSDLLKYTNLAYLVAGLKGERLAMPTFPRARSGKPPDPATARRGRDAMDWCDAIGALVASGKVAENRDFLESAVRLAVVDQAWREREAETVLGSAAAAFRARGTPEDGAMLRRHFEEGRAPMEVRQHLLPAIGACGGREALPFLFKTLALPGEEQGDLRVHALYAIEGLAEIASRSPEAVRELSSKLAGKDPREVEAASGVLMLLHRDEAADAVAEALRKEALPSLVASELLDALVVLGQERHVQAMLPCLDAQDFYVRHRAVVALAEMGAASAVPRLWELHDALPGSALGREEYGTAGGVRRQIWLACARLDPKGTWDRLQATGKDAPSDKQWRSCLLTELTAGGVEKAREGIDRAYLHLQAYRIPPGLECVRAVPALLSSVEATLGGPDQAPGMRYYLLPTLLQRLRRVAYTDAGFPEFPAHLQSDARVKDLLQAWGKWLSEEGGLSHRERFRKYLGRAGMADWLPAGGGGDWERLLASGDVLVRTGAAREIAAQDAREPWLILARHLASEQDQALFDEMAALLAKRAGWRGAEQKVSGGGLGGHRPAGLPGMLSRRFVEALSQTPR